jgi:oligosaccharide repeat unit polymerase
VPKFLNGMTYSLFLAAITCFAVGCACTKSYLPTVPTPKEQSHYVRVIRWMMWSGFCLVVLANIIWIGFAIKNGLTGAELSETFDGNSTRDVSDLKKEVFITIPGVTTATQFAMATSMFALYLWYFTGKKRYLAVIGILFTLALMRALLRAERLAIIEIGVSVTALAIWLIYRYRPVMSARMDSMMRAAPTMLIILAITVFGVFEYFRSWKFYQHQEKSFVGFVVNRFTGYYATSINNGALTITPGQEFKVPYPYLSLHFLWANPISPGYEHLTGVDYDEEFMGYLDIYANPEFNTPSGIAYYFIDYGIWGAMLGWFITGYIIGIIHRQFVVGRIYGLFMYPLIWLSLLYMPMASLLMSGRLFPSYLMIAVAWWITKAAIKQEALASQSIVTSSPLKTV